eukprot:3032561-Prymnesium_polylepis.1
MPIAGGWVGAWCLALRVASTSFKFNFFPLRIARSAVVSSRGSCAAQGRAGHPHVSVSLALSLVRGAICRTP